MTKPKLKDHREIGRELDLFLFDELSPGSAFWLPKGMVIFKELEKFIRSIVDNKGYQEISTPIIVKTKLFKKSGHWEFFKNNMFNLSVWDKEEETEALSILLKAIREKSKKEHIKTPAMIPIKLQNEDYEVRVQEITYLENGNIQVNGVSLPVNYSIKPMNCPESTVVFKSKTRSYKDLPLRLSEFGRLHRNEPSGTLNGMYRVRQMVMDDAHVFCRKSQIQSEITEMLDTTLDLYKKLNLPITFGLATRPVKAMGDKKTYEHAEEQLSEALKTHKIEFQVLKGEGAFYGPKIHIDFMDSLERTWTMATIQVDFLMPKSLDISYIAEDGKKETPVMIHRAILGSFERFVGIITEEYQGAFPIWLSPIQAIILPITDKFLGYARKIEQPLREIGIRTEIDSSNETLQAKIREATLQKIPYLLVVGSREEADETIAVRTRHREDQEQMTLQEFKKQILADIEKKS